MMVSIIVPVYGVEKYISKCIESIIEQDFQNIELLLVDDGSLDGSGLICDKYAEKDKRVKVYHTPNAGVSSARNFGLRQATGNYVMFVDGDDWIESSAVSKMLRCILINNLDICFCKKYYKDDNSLIKQPISFSDSDNPIKAGEMLIEHLRYRVSSSVCLSIFKSNIIKQCLFDTELCAFEDWEFIFKALVVASKVGVVDYSYYHYRTVLGSASKSSLNEKKLTCLFIPQKVRDILLVHCSEYLIYADGLEAVFLNHIMVSAANSGATFKQYVGSIKAFARNSLTAILKSKNILKRQKVYAIITALSPCLFVAIYRMKYINRRMKK